MTESTAASHPLPLESIHLPPVPSFWPVAWGWWTLILIILASVFSVLLFLRWRKRRLKAKKAAIALLTLEKDQLSPSGAMEIVRQAVLSYYPRVRVAQLSGESWLTFLDSQVKEPIFTPSQQQWLTALYQKETQTDNSEFIRQCDLWLNSALPPKRGGRE